MTIEFPEKNLIPQIVLEHFPPGTSVISIANLIEIITTLETLDMKKKYGLVLAFTSLQNEKLVQLEIQKMIEDVQYLRWFLALIQSSPHANFEVISQLLAALFLHLFPEDFSRVEPYLHYTKPAA